MDGQGNALGPEVDDERVTLELAGIVGVELDARVARIDFLADDATAGEDAVDFLYVDVEGQGRDVDGSVFALGLVFGGLLLLRRCLYCMSAKHVGPSRNRQGSHTLPSSPILRLLLGAAGWS